MPPWRGCFRQPLPCDHKSPQVASSRLRRRIAGCRSNVSTAEDNLTCSRCEESPSQWVTLAEELVVCGRLLRSDLISRIDRWDLTAGEFSMLWLCRRAPSSGWSQRELAEAMAVSPAQVSGLVEQLRRKGLLAGRRAESDRRRQLWRLTSDGQAKLRAVLADLTGWATELDQCWSAQEVDRLLAMLTRLSRAADNRASADAQPRRDRHADSPNPREAA